MSIELYITVWVEHWSRANILYQTSQRVIHSNPETLILPIMIVNGLSKSIQENQNQHQNSHCTYIRHLHHHLVRVLQGRLQGEEGILEPSRKEVGEIGSWYGGADDKMPARNFFLKIVAKVAIILINVGWQFIGEVIKQRFNYRRTAGLPFFLWNTIAQNRYRSLNNENHFQN